MDHLTRSGRYLFAIGIAVFGIQYLTYGHFTGGLPPVPPWTPGGPWLAYLTGGALIAASISIATGTKARLSATWLGIFFFCV